MERKGTSYTRYWLQKADGLQIKKEKKEKEKKAAQVEMMAFRFVAVPRNDQTVRHNGRLLLHTGIPFRPTALHFLPGT